MDRPYYQSIRIAGTGVTTAVVTPNPALLHLLFVEKSNSAAVIIRNGTVTTANAVLSAANLGVGSHLLDVYCPAGIIVSKNANHDLMISYDPVYPGVK